MLRNRRRKSHSSEIKPALGGRRSLHLPGVPDVLRLAKLNQVFGDIRRVIGDALQAFVHDHQMQTARDGARRRWAQLDTVTSKAAIFRKERRIYPAGHTIMQTRCRINAAFRHCVQLRPFAAAFD